MEPQALNLWQEYASCPCTYRNLNLHTIRLSYLLHRQTIRPPSPKTSHHQMDSHIVIRATSGTSMSRQLQGLLDRLTHL